MNMVDEFGNNALIGAAKHGHDDVVQLLRRHQARWARAETGPTSCDALLLPSIPPCVTSPACPPPVPFHSPRSLASCDAVVHELIDSIVAGDLATLARFLRAGADPDRPM